MESYINERKIAITAYANVHEICEKAKRENKMKYLAISRYNHENRALTKLMLEYLACKW